MQNPFKSLYSWKKNGNAQVRNVKRVLKTWPWVTTFLEIRLPHPSFHQCSKHWMLPKTFARNTLFYLAVHYRWVIWIKSLLWCNKLWEGATTGPCWDLSISSKSFTSCFYIFFTSTSISLFSLSLLSPPLRLLSVCREGKQKNLIRNNERFLLSSDLLRWRGINTEHMWWAIVRRCVTAFPASACFL